MSSDTGLRPPAASRAVVCLVSLIVPSGERPAWRARRTEALSSLYVLIGRGELPRRAVAQQAWFWRAAFTGALRLRYAGFDPRQWIRGPVFLLATAAAALAILTAVTRGFHVTRALFTTGSPVLVGYLVPIAFVLLTSLLITVSGRLSLRGLRWPGAAFLLVKTAAILTLSSALWIEGGFALRAHLANNTARHLIGGFVFAVLFVAFSTGAVIWSLADQQRRCPVCLRLLATPVRIGSWGSVLEPVTTELLCDRGHGSLCLREIDMGQSDRWFSLEPAVIAYAGSSPLGLRDLAYRPPAQS